MLFDVSEEGNVPGLGLLAGEWCASPRTRWSARDGAKLKVPHMGWNEVQQTLEHPLWDGIAPGSRFYFVHSYYPVPRNRELIAGYSLYPFPFTCAVASDNLFAVQFHPEKSQAAGLRLLSNFVHWDGRYARRSATCWRCPLIGDVSRPWRFFPVKRLLYDGCERADPCAYAVPA